MIAFRRNNAAVVYFYYDSQGNVTSMSFEGTKYFFIKNIQGDVEKIVTHQGNVAVTYKYDAWGKLISKTDNTVYGIGELNPFRYRGYIYDDETGLYYLKSRYYDPITGRFLNADDTVYIGITDSPLGINTFSYCNNNPISFTDYNGNFGTPIQWACAAIGGVLGVLFGDSIARCMGLSPKKTPIRYWLVRAAVIIGGAAIGYLIGTGIIKLVSVFIKSHPQIVITLIRKLGPKIVTKIMNIFGLNFFTFMGSGRFVNFCKYFESTHKLLSLDTVKLIYNACKQLGIKISVDKGHPGTNWSSFHMHIGNKRIHIAIAKAAYKWLKRVLG